ncbi:hypothetical protein EB796_008066 [Bugula neritina]|uniref:Uncharacterized protein n=1 Tax=Bugula neritina TaxID=10212 RepID=A0A7J7K5Y9_BUGNE|nr:hypothetical protein EB796_008066 [Bugula neritina]
MAKTRKMPARSISEISLASGKEIEEIGVNLIPLGVVAVKGACNAQAACLHKRKIAKALYQQMGLTASAMAYSWSKWNGEKESDKLISKQLLISKRSHS